MTRRVVQLRQETRPPRLVDLIERQRRRDPSEWWFAFSYGVIAGIVFCCVLILAWSA